MWTTPIFMFSIFFLLCISSCCYAFLHKCYSDCINVVGNKRIARKSSRDNVIELDGVTLQGFDPGSVQVVRTKTTKVTKTTRSRSPSPVRVRRISEDGPSTPVTHRPPSPRQIRMRVVPSGHESDPELSGIIMPVYATGVTSSPKKNKGQLQLYKLHLGMN